MQTIIELDFLSGSSGVNIEDRSEVRKSKLKKKYPNGRKLTEG
jgi:hypothetical protein